MAMRNHTWTREKVDQRIASKSDRPDFMKYILENNHPGGMTRPDIDSTTTLLVLAGSETSATTLTGATYFCLKHPEKMARLVKEIRGAFGGDAKNITVSAVSSLPYLHAVFQETLRVHPTGPISVPRQIDRPGVEICGIPVPEGVSFTLPCPHSTNPCSSPSSPQVSIQQIFFPQTSNLHACIPSTEPASPKKPPSTPPPTSSSQTLSSPNAG